MTKSKYTEDPEKDKDIHFPEDKKLYGNVILQWLKACGLQDKKITHLLVAHEHGDDNKKCHMQCFVHFDERIRIKIYPAEFDLCGENYICMAQPEQDKNKLENYCKKDKDYWMYRNLPYKYGDVTIKMYLDKNLPEYPVDPCYVNLTYKKNPYAWNPDEDKELKPNIWQKLLKHRNQLTKEDLLFYAEDLEEGGDLARMIFLQGDKILKNHAEFVEIKNIPPPVWHLPQHMIDFIKQYEENKDNRPSSIDYDKYNIYKCIQSWFFKYCVNNDPQDHTPEKRKKPLFIYGPRGIGKTVFANSLLNDVNQDIADSPYIIYCRGNITWTAFERKMDTAQLLVIDDVTFIKDQEEMLKAIAVGQTTYIRSCYVDNKLYNINIPCIIMTNEISTYSYFKNSEKWKYDAIVLGCGLYLGPPGTEPHREQEGYTDMITQIDVDKYNENKKKNMFKSEYWPIFNTTRKKFNK